MFYSPGSGKRKAFAKEAMTTTRRTDIARNFIIEAFQSFTLPPGKQQKVYDAQTLS